MYWETKNRGFQAEGPASPEVGPRLGLDDNQGKWHWRVVALDQWFWHRIPSNARTSLVVSQGLGGGQGQRLCQAPTLPSTQLLLLNLKHILGCCLRFCLKNILRDQKFLISIVFPHSNCQTLWEFIIQLLLITQEGVAQIYSINRVGECRLLRPYSPLTRAPHSLPYGGRLEPLMPHKPIPGREGHMPLPPPSRLYWCSFPALSDWDSVLHSRALWREPRNDSGFFPTCKMQSWPAAFLPNPKTHIFPCLQRTAW